MHDICPLNGEVIRSVLYRKASMTEILKKSEDTVNGVFLLQSTAVLIEFILTTSIPYVNRRNLTCLLRGTPKCTQPPPSFWPSLCHARLDVWREQTVGDWTPDSFIGWHPQIFVYTCVFFISTPKNYLESKKCLKISCYWLDCSYKKSLSVPGFFTISP